jgi:hypothetical protein
MIGRKVGCEKEVESICGAVGRCVGRGIVRLTMESTRCCSNRRKAFKFCRIASLYADWQTRRISDSDNRYALKGQKDTLRLGRNVPFDVVGCSAPQRVRESSYG